MNMPGANGGNNGFTGFRPPERPAAPYRPAFGTMPLTYSGVPVPTPPARPERNTAMIVLSVALATLVLVAGTFGTLYVLEAGKRSDTAAALESSQRELATAREDAASRLDQKDSELRAAEKSRDEARDQVAALTTCRDATRAFMDAVAANKDDVRTEISDMVDSCS